MTFWVRQGGGANEGNAADDALLVDQGILFHLKRI
jgi:hypothetical protein